MYGVVYLIVCKLNGKPYVGQTKQKLHRRMEQHKVASSAIGNAIRKYGLENFTIEVIEECETLEQLNEREMFWIAYFNSKAPNGYNLTNGGEGGIPCDDTRAKLSAARKGVPKSREHCKKIGAAQKGKIISDDTRAKIGAARAGKKHSAKTKAQMSEDRTGEKNYFFGKHHTDETISNLSTAHRGKSPFVNLLRELDTRKWSYHRLAKPMCLSQSSISFKMSGNQNFTAEQVDKLEKIFGLPAEYLLARDDGKNALSKKCKTPYKNLLAEMKKRQLTYTALAKLLGLSPVTVSDKMRGIYNFTAKDIAKLVEIFGKPADYLLST